ncbi:hypothetical protein N7490_002417 [Penicillium lividum]|nr:hypothetical protein N7490_002417 [Penicillium lividum]
MPSQTKVWMDLAELQRLMEGSAARITYSKEEKLDKPTIGKLPGKAPRKRGKLTLDEKRDYQLDLFDIHSDHEVYESDDDKSSGPTNDSNYGTSNVRSDPVICHGEFFYRFEGCTLSTRFRVPSKLRVIMIPIIISRIGRSRREWGHTEILSMRQDWRGLPE